MLLTLNTPPKSIFIILSSKYLIYILLCRYKANNPTPTIVAGINNTNILEAVIKSIIINHLIIQVLYETISSFSIIVYKIEIYS